VRRVLAMPRTLLRPLAGPPRRSPEGYQLDVQLQVLLRAMSIEPELHELGVERSRRRMDKSAPLLDRVVSGVRTRDLSSPLPMRVYWPVVEDRGKLPIVVYFHGGGWVIGSIASHDGICRALAAEVGAVVVSVGYRLGPEHRFPAAVDDALLATRWVSEHAAELGGDPSRLAVAGDSAGGNLAATTALQLRDRVRFQLLVYPVTDLTLQHASYRHFAEGFLLTRAAMEWFIAHWVDESQQRNPLASPLFVEDLRGAPPATILTAGFDPLRDEGRAYAARLRDAGVPVDDRLYPSLIHGFFSMAGAIDAAAAAFDDAVAALRRGLS